MPSPTPPSVLATQTTVRLADVLDAVADTMIPPEGDWPAPSALAVGADLADQLRHEHLALISDAAGTLPPGFAEASLVVRTVVLRRLEQTDPASFDLLRRACYLGYYARPEVVAVLRARGHDVSESPQPNGYAIAPVDLATMPRTGRGRYVATSDVAAAAGGAGGAAEPGTELPS
ncbi:MAG: hypothetical protein ACFCVF_07325 [Kineosporiaceae bacterium]